MFVVVALGLAWFGLREANAVNAKLAALLKNQSLLNGKMQRAEDRMAAVTQSGKQVNRPPPKPRLPNNLEKALSHEKALLGNAACQQLQEFNREDRAVAGVRQAAWYTQPIEPYSADQVAQLVHIFANANTSYQQGGRDALGAMDWDQVLTQATTVLSPAQMDGLKIPALGGVMDRLMKAYQNQQTPK